MNLANAITCGRIALLPVLGLYWWRGQLAVALALFVVAAANDLLDGYVARRFKQQSVLGMLLDPTADKLLLLISYVVAVGRRAVPLWAGAIVIGRDVIMALGSLALALFFRKKFGPEKWPPTLTGKYATFGQILTIGLALIWDLTKLELVAQICFAVALIACTLTLSSLLQYVKRAVREVRA